MQDRFLTVVFEFALISYQHVGRIQDSAEEGDNIDSSYIRSMWILACIVQSKISKPRFLNAPICASPFERSELVSSFNQLYTSFFLPFRTFSKASIYDLTRRSWGSLGK